MKLKNVVILVALCSLLTGCVIDPSAPYTFLQSEDNITQIDILQQTSEFADWKERFVICRTLDKVEYAELLSDIVKIKGQPFWSPPSTSFGDYVIRIKYSDGVEEYISASNNAYLYEGEQLIYDTYRFTDWRGFEDMIAKYLQKE